MKNETKRNIILIGMPGSGKSTLGVLLAKALGRRFLDTDLLIQEREGRLLQDIIDQDGIERFLEIEEQALLSVDVEHCVIATGGSVVYSQKGMEALKQNGDVLYLSATYEEVEKRVTNITTRGIVLKHGCSLRDAFTERVPLYERYQDYTIDSTGKSIEESVAEIVILFPSHKI